MNSTGFLKRLEQVGRTLSFRNEKTVVVTVPTKLIPIEGSVECDAVVTEETRTAVDEILQAIGVGDQDLVIEFAKYTSEQPELISVT